MAAREGTIQPVWMFGPSIAPSDMLFYDGAAFPAWRGDLFTGAMALTHLNRLKIVDGQIISEERLLADEGWRVRSVAVAADGLIYIGTDHGFVARLIPEVWPTAD